MSLEISIVLYLTKYKIKHLERRAKMKRLRPISSLVAMFLFLAWIVALIPAGASPGAEVDRVKYDFGDVELGSSKSTIITISNTGIEEFFISDIGFQEGSSPDFSITSDPLGEVVEPDESLKVVVTYTPSAVGYVSAVMDIFWVEHLIGGLEHVSLGGAGVL